MKLLILLSVVSVIAQTANSFQIQFLQAPLWRASSVASNNNNNSKPPTPSSAIKELLLEQLKGLISQAPKNGIDTPEELQMQIVRLCQELETVNPTKMPT